MFLCVIVDYLFNPFSFSILSTLLHKKHKNIGVLNIRAVYKNAKVRVYFFLQAARIQAAGVGEDFLWRISASSRNFFTR
jgi:hypothetical protein